MNKKLVSFICCSAVASSHSGIVSSAIKGKVPNFIVYTDNGSFFKPDDLEKVNKLIDEINLNKEMKEELLELDEKYGPFTVFRKCFKFSDLAENPNKQISDFLHKVYTQLSFSIASREKPIEELQAKLENKVQEKQGIIEKLKNSLSESSSEFSKVLKALSEDDRISGGQLHVCAELFYTVMPRYEKLKKDLEITKNLAKQEKITSELRKIEPPLKSFPSHIICKSNVSGIVSRNFYEQFLKLNETQKDKILSLIKLEKNIKEINWLLDHFKEIKESVDSIKKRYPIGDSSYISSESYLHFLNQGPDFAKQPENEKNTVIERYNIIGKGIYTAEIVAIGNKTLKKETEDFEKRYPGVFFPWKKIPDNDSVKRLKNLGPDEDLDTVYDIKDPQSVDFLKILKNEEAKLSNRIANIRACIKTGDFEEDKDRDSYIKELIMLYQARETVRDVIEMKKPNEVSEQVKKYLEERKTESF